MTELVGNLQTYELRLTRIGKTGKGKSMAPKAKTKGRRMLRKVVSTLFPQDLSVLGLKASVT